MVVKLQAEVVLHQVGTSVNTMGFSLKRVKRVRNQHDLRLRYTIAPRLFGGGVVGALLDIDGLWCDYNKIKRGPH